MMTWQEAEAAYKKCKIAVMPTGSYEEHGPHLPICTDAMIAEKMCDMMAGKLLAEGVDDVLFLPPVGFGFCEYHTDFPGTISLKDTTLRKIYLELLDCLMRWGIKKFLFINNHGGNNATLRSVAMDLRNRGALCMIGQWWEILGHFKKEWGALGHADINEVSAMMYFDKEKNLVQMDKAMDPVQLSLTSELKLDDPGCVKFKGAPIFTMLRTGDVSETGNIWEYGYGTPIKSCKDASFERGEEMMTFAVNYFCEFIEEYRKVDLKGLKFPCHAYVYDDYAK